MNKSIIKKYNIGQYWTVLFELCIALKNEYKLLIYNKNYKK